MDEFTQGYFTGLLHSAQFALDFYNAVKRKPTVKPVRVKLQPIQRVKLTPLEVK